MRCSNPGSPYGVDIHYNVQIPVGDGLLLSANLFLPVPSQEGPVPSQEGPVPSQEGPVPSQEGPVPLSDRATFPAILEMIPYRKDDWRARTDHRHMCYLARHGYAGCRLDVRGTGSSAGIALDEYTPVETRDGYDVVEWLATQPWCNGNVGMWGMSYGGFTAIQVAMLCPPSLRAIVPMYATDDRYTDDVHYIGGCMTCSELAQYAVSQIGMNAMPPSPKYAGSDWESQWKTRLEQTPPWLLEWLRQQLDGPYWRCGSLAPDYDRIKCAIFHIGGWADGYTNPVLRMQERCVNAPRKALIGPWVHSTPDAAYPGPNIDWLSEMVRFFDYWLKGIENGVMDEPALTFFRQEYTPPEPFPARANGDWRQEIIYPPEDCQMQTLYLGRGTLAWEPGALAQSDYYDHRPTLGTRAALCWGGGVPPNGLSRDLRPDEALSLTYTSEPVDQPLDILGFPEVVLFLSSTAPVAHVVVRLTDVSSDGASALVSTGILNLTHREGHAAPVALEPNEVYEIRVTLKAAGYRYLPGHRLRLSLASAYWPLIWPSPYPAQNRLYRGPEHLSRLLLPVTTGGQETAVSSRLGEVALKQDESGLGWSEPPVWRIVEDVIAQTVTVKVYGGDTSIFPPDSRLTTSEMLEMTARDADPARVRLFNEVKYRLQEKGYDIDILSTGSIHSSETDFHVDLKLQVTLNGNPFFSKSWLETIARQLL